MLEVRVPDLGDLRHVEVIEVLAAVGAEVAADAVLLQLESDKAVMEITAPQAGRLVELTAGKGDKVTPGQLVARLVAAEVAAIPVAAAAAAVAEPVAAKASRGGDARPVLASATAAGLSPAPPAVVPAAVPATTTGRCYAGPAARRLARELGVDIAAVPGGGARGRILPADVKAHVRNGRPAQARPMVAAPAAPLPGGATEADFEKHGPVDYEPLPRIQKISGRRLAASWAAVPHVTQHNEADITALEALRLERKAATEARGLRLTLLAFLLRAAAIALAEMPRFNASLCPDGERLALKRYCHLGFATDTPQGLVVPVLRDAGRKDVFELAHELGALSAAARAGRLAPAQLAGSTFTVSSLGGVGGTHFTPIVNPPEVAILGAGRAQRLPRIVGERVEPRLILPLSLSYDHRVIDGVAGVRFTERIRELLEDPAALLAAVP
jgi:pyruvate dehydrogenase E2 component (dihydrolipoamide acetyltransferase)